jgi:hypothetical protein
MSDPLWLNITRDAQRACESLDYEQAVAHVNRIDIAVLPTMEVLERLPYHLLSVLLCQLPLLDGIWLLEKVNPSLLKWLANQNSDTCAGVPYLARHISNLYWSDREKHESYRRIVEAAVALFSFDREISSAEATILCQTNLEENRPAVYDYLDRTFAALNLEQCNHIFGFTNSICIDWIVSSRRELLFRVDHDRSYFNLLTAILAYCPEADVEMAISHSRRIPLKDLSISDSFERIYTARKVARNTPTPKKRLRIALCIAGQLRGYRDAFPTWSALGIAHHETSIFVHVWDDIGRKMPVPDHAYRSFSPKFSKAFANYLADIGIDEFWRRYPSLLALYSAPEKISAEMISEFYGSSDVTVESESGMHFLSNSERMYYKNQVCMDKVKGSGKEFDLVIKIRPDKSFLEIDAELDLCGIWNECCNNKVIYADRENFMLSTGGYSVGDQIAIGTPEDMECYSSVWNTYKSPRLADKMPLPYGMPSELFPHTNLAFHCLNNGILFRDINRVVPIVGGLIEPSQISDPAIHGAINADFPSDPTLRDLDLIMSLESAQ